MKKTLKIIGIVFLVLVGLCVVGWMLDTPGGALYFACIVGIVVWKHYEGKLEDQEKKHKEEIRIIRAEHITTLEYAATLEHIITDPQEKNEDAEIYDSD